MLNARTLLHRRKAHSGSGGGGGAPTVQLINGDYYSTHAGNGGDGGAASVGFNSDGSMSVHDESFSTAPYQWLTGGLGADYQIRADIISGTVAGTTGSWLSLGTNRNWAKAGTYYYHYAALTLRIRRASDFVEVASCTVSLGFEGPEPEGPGGLS